MPKTNARRRSFSDRCCNPFEKPKHSKAKVDLRNLSFNLQQKYTHLPSDVKVCGSCSKEMIALSFFSPLYVEKDSDNEMEPSSPLIENSIIEDPIFSDLSILNTEEVKEKCNNKLHQAGLEVLNQIKEKFQNSSTNSEKVLLLTLAPKSWGRRMLSTEFGASERQARKAKQLVAECGILTSPNPKKGRPLAFETESLINAFYIDDSCSRVMPGMKDYVSVKKRDGSREQVQKRLLLCNLSELHSIFKEQNPGIDISLSKFAQLRPRHCVLAGASGTHTVCVCVHHENMKLMLDGLNLREITKDSDFPMIDYHDALNKIVCTDATPECYLNECSSCPGTNELNDFLKSILADQCIDRIEYQIWQQTDRSTLRTEISDADDFVDIFCECLLKLKSHSFIAKEQSSFCKYVKNNIKDDEFLVLCDFAENYAFVAQNAAQSFHWNNDQVTIFTTVIYYTENGELKHRSLVILSDSLNHDTVAVYEFQKIIINYLKKNFNPKKMYYFTDGAAQHFKNKYNFTNIIHHETDFEIPVEWHYHATAHGKGPCDGIGGNLKRLAARASLQASSKEQILTADALYKWAKKNLTETVVFFSSKGSHASSREDLASRFASAKVIPGTQKYHSVIPSSESTLSLRKYSTAKKYDVFPKMKVLKKK